MRSSGQSNSNNRVRRAHTLRCESYARGGGKTGRGTKPSRRCDLLRLPTRRRRAPEPLPPRGPVRLRPEGTVTPTCSVSHVSRQSVRSGAFVDSDPLCIGQMSAGVPRGDTCGQVRPPARPRWGPGSKAQRRSRRRYRSATQGQATWPRVHDAAGVSLTPIYRHGTESSSRSR